MIEKKNLSDEATYVLQTETSYPYFEEYILKSGGPDALPNDTVEEARLVQAFDQITAYIKGGVDKIKKANAKVDKAREKVLVYLDIIRDRVLELNVIFIELENVDDAQTAYETLNTRGKDLEASDLIKTYLMRVIKAMNSKVDIAKHNWGKINENIDSTLGVISAGDIGINSFLLHFWMSKYSYSSERELFSKVKEKIGPTEAKAFLKELVDNSV